MLVHGVDFDDGAGHPQESEGNAYTQVPTFSAVSGKILILVEGKGKKRRVVGVYGCLTLCTYLPSPADSHNRVSEGAEENNTN